MRLSIINYIINERSFNTASGKYIYSILFVFPSLRSGTRDVRTSSSLCSSAGTLRRIPQALSTVTTIEYSISVLQLLVSYNTASGKRCCNLYWVLLSVSLISGYNTASGKRCCNHFKGNYSGSEVDRVTIPQAVSAVATYLKSI